MQLTLVARQSRIPVHLIAKISVRCTKEPRHCAARACIRAANAEVGAAEYEDRDVLVSVLAEVARNYLELRGYQQRLAIARHNTRVESDILDLARNRYRNELSGDLDVQQAQAVLASTEAQIPALEIGFDQSVHSLEVIHSAL